MLAKSPETAIFVYRVIFVICYKVERDSSLMEVKNVFRFQ